MEPMRSRASALAVSEKACRGKGCLMSKRQSKPSNAQSSGPSFNGFNIFDFGGEAQDSKIPRSKIEEYQQPGQLEGDEAVDVSDTTPLADMVGHDKVVPFTAHGRFLQPGDVPNDVPDRHHEAGPFSIFGLFQDEDENLLTGEKVKQSCCRCIPGAPDYRETPQKQSSGRSSSSSQSGGNVFSDWFTSSPEASSKKKASKSQSERKGPKKEANAAPNAAAPPKQSAASDFPVVEAFPLVEAQPAAPASSNSTAARRLLQTLQRSQGARLTILKEGYMLVHIPPSAQPGEYYKAMTPSGETWAFKIPADLPQSRIIKVHLPDLSSAAPPPTAAKSRRMSLQAVNSSSNETEIVEPPPSDVNASQLGNETSESPVQEEEHAEAAGGEAESSQSVPFHPATMGLKAKPDEPCCMCPLFDESTGQIEGWVSDSPQDEIKAARRYLYVAKGIAIRDEEVNKALNGSAIHWEGLFPSRKYACCRLELPCCYTEMEEVSGLRKGEGEWKGARRGNAGEEG
uniref:Uncharacterized protein n=1 Tax=Hanusia phi TaxID=3032 RepID=A0A7S0HJA3_9CRYP